MPHPERTFTSRRQFSLVYYEQCKRCHFSTFAKTLDSAHQAPLARGDVTAPLCVDCHGAHDIASPEQAAHARVAHLRQVPPGRVDDLLQERPRPRPRGRRQPGRPGLHRLPPLARRRGTARRRTGRPTRRTCARRATPTSRSCRKYGLSTAVYRTYVADFHGMTSSVRADGPGGQRARDRALHRLPRRPRHHEGGRPQLAGAEGEPREDLPAVPRRRQRELPRRVAVALRAVAGRRRRSSRASWSPTRSSFPS